MISTEMAYLLSSLKKRKDKNEVITTQLLINIIEDSFSQSAIDEQEIEDSFEMDF